MKAKQRNEIVWNIVNSLLSGGLVLLGSFSAVGALNNQSIYIAVVTSVTVAVTQFKDYWKNEKSEYCSNKKGMMRLL